MSKSTQCVLAVIFFAGWAVFLPPGCTEGHSQKPSLEQLKPSDKLSLANAIDINSVGDGISFASVKFDAPNFAGVMVTPVDSLPKPIIYVYSFDARTAKAVDSILLVAIRTSGYELSTKYSDDIKNGLSQIVNYFAYQRYLQDSIRSGAIKTKPLK